jgi:hypothetical protein
MKWLGQHIYDLIARFRNDVYLEDLSTTTETNVLVVDSDGKVSKNTTTIGDITGITEGDNITVLDPTGPVPKVALNTSLTGLTSVTSTSFVGALTGNAATATKIASITNDNIVQLDAIQALSNKTFSAGATFKGSTSGTTTLQATAVAGTTTLTLPAATDTLVGKDTIDTLTNKTLSAPIIAEGVVIEGSTSGTTILQATAVAGHTTLTLPAVTGTLATVGGTETLSGKTLTSPTFTGTVTGVSKSMVGLGNVDDTADSAKNVLSTTKLTTARTIGGVSFDGSANIPQRQITHHSAAFVFTAGIKQYIGLLDSDSENITASNINLPFLAPFSGKLLKIFLRSSSGLTGGQLTLRLEKNALDVNAGGIPPTVVTNNPAAQLGPANSTMTTYEWITGTHSNTIDAGDMIFISIASSSTFSNVNVKIFFTCLWEWDH